MHKTASVFWLCILSYALHLDNVVSAEIKQILDVATLWLMLGFVLS